MRIPFFASVSQSASLLLVLLAVVASRHGCVAAPEDEKTVPALPGHSAAELKAAVINKIVVFRDKPSEETLAALGEVAVQSLISLVSKYYAFGPFKQELLDRLRQAGIIDYAEPDYTVRASQQPTNGDVEVQHAPSSWALSRIDKRRYPLMNTFHYPASAGKGVNVYILDTGVNTAHRDLEGRATLGANVLANTTDGDENGHGSFVAGIVGGAKFGVAKQCNIISVKTLNAQGTAPTSAVIRAINFVVKSHQKSSNKMTILNLSLDAPVSRALNEAILQAASNNILVVVAAGNGDENGAPQDACSYSPASASLNSSIIVVGATDKNDNVATFSNYGKCVSLLAPGVNVVSISNRGPTATTTMSGTSFAAPLVSGFAALIMADNGGPIPPAELKERILYYTTAGIITGLDKPDTPNQLMFGNLIAAKAGLDASFATSMRPSTGATLTAGIAAMAALLAVTLTL